MLDSYSRLYGKAFTLLDKYYYVLQQSKNYDQWELIYTSEGLISHLWQAWNRFCRSVIIESCSGTLTKTGHFVVPRMSDNSWGRVGYEARQASKGHSISATSTIKSVRQEPTWGDRDKLIDVIKALSPNNKNSLLNGFGMSLDGPKHVQIVRNACAHLHKENVVDVNGILISYNVLSLDHPSVLIWEMKKSVDPKRAYESWVEDMLNIAGSVVAHP